MEDKHYVVGFLTVLFLLTLTVIALGYVHGGMDITKVYHSLRA